MKKTTLKSVSLVLATSLLLASCSSSTVINSSPNGAKVYIDGSLVGTTPYKYSDSKIVGSTTTVRLEKEGYDTFLGSFSRSEQADVGAIIGGLLVFIPFLWTMKYNSERTYELTPSGGTKTVEVKKENGTFTKSKSEELKALKQLLDDNAITIEEYEKEKKKILDN